MIAKQNQNDLASLKLLSLLVGMWLGSITVLLILLLVFILSRGLVPVPILDDWLRLLPAWVYNGLVGQARLMGFPLQGESAAFWYMGRISGLLAYLLLWASTAWGLLLGTKIVKTYLPLSLTFSLHEFLSWLGLGFSLFHPLILLGDRYVNFSLSDILLPFSASFEPFWLGLGTLSLYLYALIVVSFYSKKWLGAKTWRALHYLSLAVYGLALWHGLAVGSESDLSLVRFMYLGSAASILFLTLYRVLSRVPATE